ncbi:hypothetical protein HGA64_01315 [Candidatus Falkowbacteria bacterium]|nr:hypothetical protein [Candidatus Falkowbacteria bacterium]
MLAKLKYSKIFWGAIFFLFFSILWKSSFSYLDPDFGWHLRVGQDILKNRAVPQVDGYTFTHDQNSWVDHEWLFNVIVYLGYEHFGYPLLSFSFALIILSVLYLLWKYRFNGLDSDGGWFVFVSLWGLFAIKGSMGVRMQEVGLLGLLLVMIIMDLYEKKRDYKILFWLLPIFVVWANLHFTFVIALVVIFGKILFEFLRGPALKIGFFRKNVPAEAVYSKTEVMTLALFLFLSVLATLINPYGYRLYEFLKTFSNSYYLTRILEWLPFYFAPAKLFYFIFLSLAIFISLYWVYKLIKKRNVDNWWYFSLAILFTIMSLKSRRHLPLLFVAATPWLVSELKREFGSTQEVFRHVINNRYAKLIILLIVFGSSVYLIKTTHFTSKPFSSYCQMFPCEAVADLKTKINPSQTRILNNFGWGGYMDWTWPELRLFIDGRQPQQLYGTKSLLEVWDNVFDLKQTDQKLKEHRINLILIPKNKSVDVTWLDQLLFGLKKQEEGWSSKIIPHLMADKNWGVCHEDSLAIAFCKK